MQVIVLYFFGQEAYASFYQEAGKVYSNQPLAGIFSILLHFPPHGRLGPRIRPSGILDSSATADPIAGFPVLRIYDSLRREKRVFVPLDPAVPTEAKAFAPSRIMERMFA